LKRHKYQPSGLEFLAGQHPQLEGGLARLNVTQTTNAKDKSNADANRLAQGSQPKIKVIPATNSKNTMVIPAAKAARTFTKRLYERTVVRNMSNLINLNSELIKKKSPINASINDCSVIAFYF